ncbi:MAG: flagellar biosynthetic protein FliR [Lachnospira sp.]
MINYTFVLEEFEIFLLILMRLASFIFAAPFFNTSGVPQRLKIGFALCFSILVYSIYPDMEVEYNGVIEYALLVLEEVIIGLILGMSAFFCVQIIQFAGKIIDMEVGLSMAQIYDPTSRTQVGIMGNFYYYLVMLLLIISGLYRYLVAAIVETYKVIPIGGVKFSPGMYKIVVEFMADYFVIGFRIALPVFAATLLLNCILAIMAKIAPQMNMFVVGMQLKIFVGIFVILFTISMLPAVSDFIFDRIKILMASLVRGMS